MNVKSYAVELPESAFSALRKSPAEFIEEMKRAAMVKVNIVLNASPLILL